MSVTSAAMQSGGEEQVVKMCLRQLSDSEGVRGGEKESPDNVESRGQVKNCSEACCAHKCAERAFDTATDQSKVDNQQ